MFLQNMGNSLTVPFNRWLVMTIPETFQKGSPWGAKHVQDTRLAAPRPTRRIAVKPYTPLSFIRHPPTPRSECIHAPTQKDSEAEDNTHGSAPRIGRQTE
jgi:hypothetical protein